MTRPSQRLAQRRTEGQQTGAFTFWFRRPHAVKHAGAWMLNQSAREAAFLTAAFNAPRVGERLELSEPESADLAVSDRPSDHAGHPSRFGRVVQLCDSPGTTRRVTIQFESQPG